MNYKVAKEYFHRCLEEILQNYKGIKDNNLLKLLLKYNLKNNGLNPLFPFELFQDILSLADTKRRYIPINNNEQKKIELYSKIIN